jgi:hypothetical protein
MYISLVLPFKRHLRLYSWPMMRTSSWDFLQPIHNNKWSYMCIYIEMLQHSTIYRAVSRVSHQHRRHNWIYDQMEGLYFIYRGCNMYIYRFNCISKWEMMSNARKWWRGKKSTPFCWLFVCLCCCCTIWCILLTLLLSKVCLYRLWLCVEWRGGECV